jgi:hypothetical protein
MSIGTILLIILVLALVGVLPTWSHSRSWGYGPSSVDAGRGAPPSARAARRRCQGTAFGPPSVARCSGAPASSASTAVA